MQFTNVLGKKAGKIGEAVAAANENVITTLEQVTDTGLASCQYYSSVTYQQLRIMASIRDVESFRQSVADTITMAGDAATRLINDTNAMMAIGTQLGTKVRDSFSDRDPDAAPQDGDKKPIKKAGSTA